MIYPTLYISEDNSSIPYIQMVDGDFHTKVFDPIPLHNSVNSVSVLYSLLQCFLEQYDEGFDEGFWEGMNNIDDDMEDML